MKNTLLLFMMIGSLTSCSNYYKAALATTPPTANSISDLQSKNKFFILRNGNQAFAMKDISFSTDGKSMICRLDSLKYEHVLHLTLGRHSKMRYRNSANEDESDVLNEVHIYTNPNGPINAGPYSLTLDQVQKIEILEPDKRKTNSSHAIGIGIGTAAAVVAGVGLIAIAASTITIF